MVTSFHILERNYKTFAIYVFIMQLLEYNKSMYSPSKKKNNNNNNNNKSMYFRYKDTMM